MFDVDRDLRIASVFARDLKLYLLNDNLYWTLSEPGPFANPYPMGTLGGLFLRLSRLDALRPSLSPEQTTTLDETHMQTDAEVDKWVVQAEAMMLREVKARLQLWGAYVAEFTAEPKRFWNEYATQVENRAILKLLLARGGRSLDGHGFLTQIDGVDKQLMAAVVEGPFVWDSLLENAYDKASHWWLYVEPLMLN